MNEKLDYICEEVFGNQFIRLLRFPYKLGLGVCLITQHFHIRFGRYQLEIDW